MTVLLTHSFVNYIGTGAVTVFPVTFSYSDPEDLLVEQRTGGVGAWTEKVMGVDYDVTGDGLTEPGGQVEMNVAPGNNDDLRITRNTPVTQPTAFGTFTKFTGRTHELAMDHRTRGLQDVLRRLEELEALGDLVTVTDLADGVEISDEVTAADPTSATFPITIACAGGANAKHIVWHVYATAADDNPMVEPPQVDWVKGPGNFVTVRAISGLTPAIDYTIDGLVFF